MKLVHKIDENGFFVEDVMYIEEWIDGSLVNPISVEDGLVEPQPIGLHTPKWDFDNNVWVEGQDITEAINQVKQDKLTQLTHDYTVANGSDIDYLNKKFQADASSQALIASVLSVGALPVGFFWKDLNNDKIPMTFKELQGLSGALVSRGLGNFSKLSDLKEQVNIAETLHDLELIEWNTTA